MLRVNVDELIMYPARTNVLPVATQRRYGEFRTTWILIARMRPVIPCPEHTRLPNRKGTKASRAKLLNIYKRLWVLGNSDRTAAVPFLRDLDLARYTVFYGYSKLRTSSLWLIARMNMCN